MASLVETNRDEEFLLELHKLVAAYGGKYEVSVFRSGEQERLGWVQSCGLAVQVLESIEE